MAGCRFSFDHYRDILKQAKAEHYTTIKISDTAKKQHSKVLAIRHDVDTSPYYALEMAKIEHEEGVVSSYYVLLHSPFYNPFTSANLKIFREILKLGHEIGLHYDISVYGDKKEAIIQGIKNEIKILELALQVPIKSISQHNPALSTYVEEFNKFVVDAYNKNLINGEYKYISDSGYKWRQCCICKILGKHEKIHLLIHPNTWSLEGKGYKDILYNNLHQIEDSLKEEVEKTIAEIEEYLKKRDKLDALRSSCYLK